MRAPKALVMLCVTIAGAAWAVAAQEAAPPAAKPVMTVAAVPDPAGRIIEESYMLTWQKDPRFRTRDPFSTVLHPVDGARTRSANLLVPPRTPGEEAAFVARADACVKEANAALDEADYKAVKENMDLLKQMVAVPLVTETARTAMAGVKKQLADTEAMYGQVRARAALTEALQLAARMQAYYDTARFGEVVTLDDQVQALNTADGLGNPEVAATAAGLLEKCAELKRRAQVHLEFSEMQLKIDALSHFPEGRSFAIINGEVFGEGGRVMPELTVASVSVKEVTFDFKGERISLGLAQ